MWKALVPLIVGGSLGAVSRWGLHQWIDSRLGANSPFPWGILLVNIGGCFLFGWLFAFCEGKAWSTDAVRLAIFTGFLGSFTTFSTFGWNTLERSPRTPRRVGRILARTLSRRGIKKGRRSCGDLEKILRF